MMNPNSHGGAPMYHGRRPHDLSYNPQPHYPPSIYYHPQHIPQNFHHHAPPQWAYYNVQGHVPQAYQQTYPPVVNNPYSMAHSSSISPRPNHPQHLPPSPSTHSLGGITLPSPASDRSTHLHQPGIPPSRPSPPPAPPPQAIHRADFKPPLPWYSVPADEYPKRKPRRRKIFTPDSPNGPVELPIRSNSSESLFACEDIVESNVQTTDGRSARSMLRKTLNGPRKERVAPTVKASEEFDQQDTALLQRSENSSHTQRNGRAIPIVPVIPNLPFGSRTMRKTTESAVSELPKSLISATENETESGEALKRSALFNRIADSLTTTDNAIPMVVGKSAPKSWADLVRVQASEMSLNPSLLNGQAYVGDVKTSNVAIESKAEFFSSFSVRRRDSGTKISFLKPRGLVNTGNMCYMNSILLFCVPFHDFIEQARKQAAYSFKNETPMIDAMIEFVREFNTIDSAPSAEQLNMRLKDKELEEYGEAFTPVFVYEVIRRLPRFSSMRRGHQQDAEEFLGFLLEEMHEECIKVMKGSSVNLDGTQPLANSFVAAGEGDWHEVGRKQKAAITRSTGVIEAESPINKIFGGKLRHELRVPGTKISVTMEPYQSLQLDIGSPHVNNIIDALKGLTRSEMLQGDFSSPRGPGLKATKQVFVESLPPVLILLLKRFQYDNTGGTQKIWKKVGYPLELEIPKEVFPAHKRASILAHGGLPKYRLVGVVYHHGKNASGGHYTVDIRRQNDREWIRLDDTIIRRVRAEDVAEAGAEEDPKVIAAALEQHKRDEGVSTNIFDIVQDEGDQMLLSEKGWNQVNGSAIQPKKWSGILNGNATPGNSSGLRTPVGQYSAKDNKVAYILFYQKQDY